MTFTYESSGQSTCTLLRDTYHIFPYKRPLPIDSPPPPPLKPAPLQFRDSEERYVLVLLQSNTAYSK